MSNNSVNKLIEQSFRSNWDRDALSNYQGITLKYCDLARQIALLHLCFKNLGLKKGDKIALCAKNQAGWGVCFLAAMTYGAVPVPILHEFKPENIHYLVNHSDSRLLFVDGLIWESLSETEMPALDAIFKINDLSSLYVRRNSMEGAMVKAEKDFRLKFSGGFAPGDISYYEDRPDDLALINYTSGTSGFSKGVMLPYRSLMCNIRLAGNIAEPQMNCCSHMVAMLPSAHMYGMMFDFLFEMTIGAHVHFLTRVPSPKIIMKAFREIHPDAIIAVPLIIEKVYKSTVRPIVESNRTLLGIPIVNQMVLRKIRKGMIEAFGGRFEEVILGGAPLNPEVEQFLRRVRFPFTVGYGMTECGPLITYAKWYRTRKGSCGMPIEGCRIKIDSPNPQKIPGEVLVKGDNVFLGYYKNRQATRLAFTNDDWFKTGDMGVVDSDGYLYLRGRSKCMILGPSGQNIYPEELEAVINNVDSVTESLVIEDHGGLIALIYPDYHHAELNGMSREELEDKVRACLPDINKSLPSYAQIRKIEFMPEDFERTPKRSIKRYLYQRN